MDTTATHINYFNLLPGTEEQDFDTIYLDHYSGLHQYAYTMLGDAALAEEMVHQVFLKILERTRPVDIHTSLKAYLYRSVNNECLNHLKHQKVKQNFGAYAESSLLQPAGSSSERLQYRELEQRLTSAINQLPEHCRTIFQLSRFEELKYAEIAAQLGISVKTVEAQMSKALKRLRVQLADYLPLIFWLLISSML